MPPPAAVGAGLGLCPGPGRGAHVHTVSRRGPPATVLVRMATLLHADLGGRRHPGHGPPRPPDARPREPATPSAAARGPCCSLLTSADATVSGRASGHTALSRRPPEQHHPGMSPSARADDPGSAAPTGLVAPAKTLRLLWAIGAGGDERAWTWTKRAPPVDRRAPDGARRGRSTLSDPLIDELVALGVHPLDEDASLDELKRRPSCSMGNGGSSPKARSSCE